MGKKDFNNNKDEDFLGCPVPTTTIIFVGTEKRKGYSNFARLPMDFFML